MRTIEEEDLNVTLLLETLSKSEGIWWYSDNRVMVHGKRSAVVLRNSWAEAWKQQGSHKWIAERVAMVTVNQLKLVAVYQPVSPNEFGIEDYRRSLEKAIACRKKDEMLVICGDHKAQVRQIDRRDRARTIGGFGFQDQQQPEKKLSNGTTTRIIPVGYLFPEEEQGHVVPSRNWRLVRIGLFSGKTSQKHGDNGR